MISQESSTTLLSFPALTAIRFVGHIKKRLDPTFSPYFAAIIAKITSDRGRRGAEKGCENSSWTGSALTRDAGILRELEPEACPSGK